MLDLEETTALRIPPTCLDVGHFETVETIARLLAGLSAGPLDHARAQQMNNVLQVDDRDKACARFLAAPGPIEALILGSSRTQHLSPGIASRHGLTAFNFWLMGARAED